MIMKCISREEGIQLLWDIQSDICESHSSWRFIIEKAFMHFSTGLQPRMM
jgi:hypothetical protein